MRTQIVTVRMEEELVQRLEALAGLKGITRSALLKELLQAALSQQDRVREALATLRRGEKPQTRVDWDCIQQKLEQSEPCFPTLEQAMSYTRRRPWAKG